MSKDKWEGNRHPSIYMSHTSTHAIATRWLARN